ncbi:hypothetical protein R3I93_001552 [Phoxinus phoxinus]|uniref:Uncharacterized protein n=1 Tax=Phoxinus phoxinus TaxID=58324 RepID=A0AAN9DJI3_9TELE
MKTFRVDEEKWKERQQKKKGRYVTPLRKPFVFKKSNKKVETSVPVGPIGDQKSSPLPSSSLQEDHEKTLDGKALPADISNKPQEPSKTPLTTQHQLTSLWKRRNAEVVVSVIPTQNTGQTIIIRHKELRTLQPHRWLYGDV